MSIATFAVGDTITAAWLNSVAGALNARVPVIAQSGTNTGTTTTTEVKDTQVGDLTLTVTDASAWYEVRYVTRAGSSVAADSLDIRVRDGGGSSPTNVSTQIAGQSLNCAGGGATAQTALTAESPPIQLSVGTHILAGFFVRTAGTGNVSLTSAAGATRFLSVKQIA